MDQTVIQTFNVYPTQGYAQPVALANSQGSTLKLFASSTFSLMVIGIGSIVFGCADLVAGFMAFSYMWSWAWLFTYAWAGFLFAVISGSLVLKAATVKPHVDQHWTNVAFGFGIATLVMHVVDAAIVVTSVVTLAIYDWYIISQETEDSYVGLNNAYYYNFYYYYQSALIAEAPRLVIVSVLLALDIWLLVVTSKLREHFRKIPSSSTAAFVMASPSPNVSQNTAYAYPVEDQTLKIQTNLQAEISPGENLRKAKHHEKDIRLLACGRTALIACGIFSLVYGVAELVSGVCTILTWNSPLYYYYSGWLSLGFTIVSFVFSVVNGALALRAAYNKPNVGKWSQVVVVVGSLAIVSYLVAVGFCLYTLFMTGVTGLINYTVDSGKLYGTQFDIVTTTRIRKITPAVPDAARLVALFVLICAAATQVSYAAKLKKLFKSNPTITLTPTSGAQTAPVSVYPYPTMPAGAVAGYYPPQANNNTYVFSPAYTAGYNVTPVYPAGQQIVVSGM